MGHEYVGVVEEIGADVKNVKVGDFVIGSFFASDKTCEICQDGYQSRCVNNVGMGGIGTQSEYARISLADGTLVATPSQPADEQIPHLLAASNVLGTGLVRRGGRRSWAGQDGSGGRRRRRGPFRSSRRQAARC